MTSALKFGFLPLCSSCQALLQPPGYGPSIRVGSPSEISLLLYCDSEVVIGQGLSVFFVARKQDIVTDVTRPEIRASANRAHI